MTGNRSGGFARLGRVEDGLSRVAVARVRAAMLGVRSTRPRLGADVERLLQWAMEDQRRHEWCGGGLRVSNDGCVAVERAMRLGVVIRGSFKARAGFVASCDVPAASEAIYNATTRIAPRDGELVRRHAVLWSRPDWIPEGANLVPVLDHLGAIRVCRYDRNRNRVGDWCPLTYDNTPATVRSARGEYARWWRALRAVALLLVGAPSLGVVVASGPSVPAKPWAMSR